MLEMKYIFKQEKIIPQLMFNPGLTLTGFRTTRPWSSGGGTKVQGQSIRTVIDHCTKTAFTCSSDHSLWSNFKTFPKSIREHFGAYLSINFCVQIWIY